MQMDTQKENKTPDEKIRKGVAVKLQNEQLLQLEEDHLYHIALTNVQHDLKELFGDVKFVCFGGQATRMEKFARFIAKELDLGDPDVKNYAGNTDRYVVYKAGPVLSVSHGIGIPSLSIIFQEIVKLVCYAGCQDVTFFRIGTSGGIVYSTDTRRRSPPYFYTASVATIFLPGYYQYLYAVEKCLAQGHPELTKQDPGSNIQSGLSPGTVVISERVVNGALEPALKVNVLGTQLERPAVVDTDLVDDLCSCSLNTDKFKTVKGTTMCADDFYEGQGRVDGAFCEHSHEDKRAWLETIHKEGVTNMEMESLGFIAMCHRANIRGAVCCVTLLDRFQGDGLTTNLQLLHEWQTYPQILVARFIRKHLSNVI